MAIDSQMGSWKMRASCVNSTDYASFLFFPASSVSFSFFSFLLHLRFPLYSVASGFQSGLISTELSCLMVNVISSCDSPLSLQRTLDIYPCTLALRDTTSLTRPHTRLLSLAVLSFHLHAGDTDHMPKPACVSPPISFSLGS